MSSLAMGVGLTGAVAAAAVGGVFFAFSTFVSSGLTRSGGEVAAVAMRSINESAVRPPLMLLLFGTSALTIGGSFYEWRSGQLGWATAAFAVYLVSVIGVTVIRNVPLNNRLAEADPTSVASGQAWSSFITPWLRWNHARAAGAVVTALCMAHFAGR